MDYTQRKFLIDQFQKRDTDTWLGSWHLYDTDQGQLLFISSTYGYAQTLLPSGRIDLTLIHDLRRHRDLFPDDVIVGVSLEETTSQENGILIVDELERVLKSLQRVGALKRYTILLNMNWQDKTLESMKALSDNLYVLPWFLCSYKHIYEQQLEWNATTEKVLHLPGKPEKKQRIGSMIYAKRNDLLQHMVYSFISLPTQHRDMDEWFSQLESVVATYDPDNKLNGLEIFEEMSTIDRDLDGFLGFQHSIQSYSEHPPGSDIYNLTSVELVNETWWMDHKHLTEKTFRPIWAGQPFIHVGSHFTRLLISMGFHTFQDYTSYKSHNEYSLLLPDNYTGATLDAQWAHYHDINNCVDAAVEFAQICKQDDIAPKIKQHVNYNRFRAEKITQNHIKQLTVRHPGFSQVEQEIFSITHDMKYEQFTPKRLLDV